VENPLASKLLRGEFKEGDTILVNLKGEVLTFSAKNKRVKRPRAARPKKG